MPSLIAWLDSTPEEQKAARELIAMFSEKESRDELGIGPIRDAFSDLLFPGTSVLQTRARYYLMIPWCYTHPDVARFHGAEHRRRGRGKEQELIKTVRGSDAEDRIGLIGARAGVGVRALPSDLYWNGMIRYGVREYRGAIGSLPELSASEGATEVTDRAAVEWCRTIPPAPKGFPASTTEPFRMSESEATWLREQILSATSGTVLAHLLERSEPIPDNADAPWEAVPESSFPELHHARRFSVAMHGAALLYNLIIARRWQDKGFGGDEDKPAVYLEALGEWQDELRDLDLASWDLDAMWGHVKRANPNIPSRTQDFVEHWVRGIRSGVDVADETELRRLVEEREKRKGAQSRLKNEKMLAAWSGASGTGRLTYRWGTVRTIVNDILRGLDDAGS